MLLNIGVNKKICEIPIVQIRPCRNQIRKNFSRDQMRELALSVRQNGILQPVTVRRISSTEFELIAGERRLRAAAMCGKKKIPCIVLSCEDKQAGIYSVIENIQRCRLDMFEQARAVDNVIKSCRLSRTDTARLLGKKQSELSDMLSLLRLTDEEKEIILKYELTERHAYELLRISDTVLRKTVLCEIIEEGLNVSQTRAYIDEVIARKHEEKTKKQKRRIVIKDIRIFENTINKAVDTMRSSGIEAVSTETETNEFIEYIVRIPKANPNEDKKKTKTA